MYTVIIQHRVADYLTWRDHYELDEGRRKKAGLKNIRVFQDHKDENLVYVIWEMDEVAGLDLFINDPDLEEAMKTAGVISKPEITVIKEAKY